MSLTWPPSLEQQDTWPPCACLPARGPSQRHCWYLGRSWSEVLPAASLLPPSCPLPMLSNGRMTTLQFYGHILQGPLGLHGAHRGRNVPASEPLVAPRLSPGDWHSSRPRLTHFDRQDPWHHAHARCGYWRDTSGKLPSPLLAKLGHGGPALSNAAFNASIVVAQ